MVRHTEYGGGAGALNRFPDGSEKDLSAGEAARVLRMAGARGDVDTDSAAGEVRPAKIAGGSGLTRVDESAQAGWAARQAALKALQAKSNRYIESVGTLSEESK